MESLSFSLILVVRAPSDFRLQISQFPLLDIYFQLSWPALNHHWYSFNSFCRSTAYLLVTWWSHEGTLYTRVPFVTSVVFRIVRFRMFLFYYYYFLKGNKQNFSTEDFNI